jgi:predicted nucleic acid-binding protein
VRVFLDANILFSAAKSDGPVRALLRMLHDGGHQCCADAYVVVEATRNLEAKGPEALATLDALLLRVKVAPGIVTGRAPIEADWLPEKDKPVLAAAMHLHCDALVTGDRTHFGRGYGRTFGGVVIHSPRSLGELLQAGGKIA